MDLNRPPSNPNELDLNRLPNNLHYFPSFIDIKVVCRKKSHCREVLVRKYGEERYNVMLQTSEPVILSCFMNFKIIIFVFYT